MSADTVYRVKVLVGREEWVEVAAVTRDEARGEAERQKGVIRVLDVLHYSDFCSNCDSPLPEGCGGTLATEKACLLHPSDSRNDFAVQPKEKQK